MVKKTVLANLQALKAMKNLKADRGVIVTYNQEETIDDTLSIVPFWKYF